MRSNIRRDAPFSGNNLIVRPCAVIVTEIGLLAQGRNVIWVQDAAELDEGDWSLFESLKRDSTFTPPANMRVRHAPRTFTFSCPPTLQQCLFGCRAAHAHTHTHTHTR